MSLTISDISYDESFTLDATDQDVGSLSAALQAQIGALASLTYYTAPIGFPQYAELTDFVSSTNPVTNYVLAKDSAGDAFSKSTGIATDLYVGASQVSLYATDDPNIVVGRIGGSSGDVVLVIALNETKDGTGHVTGTDLGVVVYAPLVHSDGSAVDDGDTLDLSGLIYLYDTYSTVSVVPFNDFSKVASGADAFALIASSDPAQTTADLLLTGFAGSTEGTVNVSTTGLGANAQTVANGSSLRIDVVSANAADFAKEGGSPPGVHDASNIAFENHVEAISAGFELTQNNPTGKLASLTISAYEVSGNHTGTDFVSHAFNDGTLVKIDPSMVVIHDDQGNDITSTFGGTITQSADGKSILITGLAATDHVDFTATSQFDRFIVTNTMTSSTDKTTFDVGAIHVSTITGGVGHEAADLGSHLYFEDAGPSISTSGTPPSLTVDETTLGPTGDDSASFAGLFNPDYGPDGGTAIEYDLHVKSSGVNSGLIDTATGHGIFLYIDASGNVVGRVGSSLNTASSTGDIAFTISVDSDGNVNLDQARAIVHPDATDPNDSKTMAAADLVTLTATITDGDGDSATSDPVGIATSLHFLDDGPAALGVGDSVTVGNSTTDLPSPALPHSASESFALDPGSDGFGSFTFTGTPDSTGDYRWTLNAAKTVLTETYKGTPLFTVTLASDGSYTANMLSTLPDTLLPLDANKIKAGGPTGSIDVGTMGATGDHVLITGTASGSIGAVNASNGNVGVNNGNLDSNEALTFVLYDSSNNVIPVHGINIGTKTAQSATYHVVAQVHGGGTFVHDYVVGKNGTIVVDAGNLFLDSITVTDTNGNAVKIGLSGISLLLPPSDESFTYNVQLTDKDGDPAAGSFTLNIDGNNDGSITGPISPAAVLGAAALSASAGAGPTHPGFNAGELTVLMERLDALMASHPDWGTHLPVNGHLPAALEGGHFEMVHSHLIADQLLDL